MAYQSLYRRYRSGRFDEVRGQEHVVRALRNAVRDERVGHAYLFSGPRGTGKTSTARILAKALNCDHLDDGEPCGTCDSCRSIEAGTSFDLHELDAASNNGVEAVRDLISRTSIGSPGRTKVYILDEVHMLSAGASNALLKTLEEPPPHVVFVLATTDPHKVLPTIRSRTQHLEFGLLPADVMAEHVRWVVADAELDVTEEGIAYALRQGGGSARDTLSALDQVAAAGGVPAAGESIDELVEALCESDTAAAMVAVSSALSFGREPRPLAEDLLGRLRDIFLASVHGPLHHLTDADQARATEQASRLGRATLTRALELVGEAIADMRHVGDTRIPLEVALVRMTRPDLDTTVEALLERVARLERLLADGAVPAPAAPAPAAPAPAAPAPAAPAPAA
ncbi:MAG: DNA polymerase III subunit gamma/tau, partial [Acidimicrobiia bacterium]|nr:DNA polymerase III subunit gamma/tau [Acidimicrobiia bacterium]